jgi:hypothetical protein
MSFVVLNYFAITHCSFQSADNQHFNSRFLEVWNGLNDNQQTRLSLSLQILTTVQGDDAPSVSDHVFDTLEVLLRTNDLFDEGHVNHMSSFVAMLRGWPIEIFAGLLSLIEPHPITFVSHNINGHHNRHESQGTVSAVSGASDSIVDVAML